jgi:hypothetical protein
MTTRQWDLCHGDLPHAPAQAQPTARRMPEPMVKAIALLLTAVVVLAACHAEITHVNVYPAFGPHYGDGGGGGS